jgi:hypothetical protein
MKNGSKKKANSMLSRHESADYLGNAFGVRKSGNL